MPELLQQLPIPTIQQAIFVPMALITAIGALIVVLSPNLFHNALGLVLTLFGVAGIFAMLEAEFLAVSQILIYVGAIATLITFGIMLTRGMMFGRTSANNRQLLTASITASLFFLVLMGLLLTVPWPEVGTELGDGEAMIASLGEMFVTTYVLPFELMALLLLVALAGALLLARDR